jgi:transcriptional regulator with XRE-family HTH domain
MAAPDALGDVIRARRDELGLSQERFARMVDVSTNTVISWEKQHGDDDERSGKFPDYPNLCALVQKAGIPAESLLGTPTVSKTNGLEVAV